jgi:hypothetical protein
MFWFPALCGSALYHDRAQQPKNPQKSHTALTHQAACPGQSDVTISRTTAALFDGETRRVTSLPPRNGKVRACHVSAVPCARCGSATTTCAARPALCSVQVRIELIVCSNLGV